MQYVSRLLAGLTGGLLLAAHACHAWAQADAASATSNGTTNHGLTQGVPAANAAATASASLPSSSSSVFSMLLGLVVVLAVMAAIAWALKRFGLTRPLSGNAAAKVIGGVSVGTRERVMVIEVGEQWIVIGVAPGRVNALATMPRQEHVAASGPANGPAPAFASWLKQTMDKRHNATHGGGTGNDGSTP